MNNTLRKVLFRHRHVQSTSANLQRTPSLIQEAEKAVNSCHTGHKGKHTRSVAGSACENTFKGDNVFLLSRKIIKRFNLLPCHMHRASILIYLLIADDPFEL
jgi:hypothetical protein